jgi:outer membrane protein OmpA-like peptidoglycan-associated protein
MIINPQLNLLISGHTDEKGTPDYNLNLSRLRAEAIAEYIIKNGIPGKRVHTIGYGSRLPLSKESGNNNAEKNRRVEFMFY